jgi:hypothetical protein
MMKCTDSMDINEHFFFICRFQMSGTPTISKTVCLICVLVLEFILTGKI